MMNKAIEINQKLEIFKTLFKGREDVFAQYWQSNNGNSGYSPVCGNRFKKGICSLKCNGCMHKKYVPLNDQAIKDHLQGKSQLGIYPLLPDGTCHFMAVDFDKHDERSPGEPLEDAKSLVDICKVEEIPAYLERSKSGHGYHTWIFFYKPVPAWKARLVVSALLKEAQVVDEESTSFDRLFPNQDTIRQDGIGNLIALPIYGKVFNKGNATFLNQDLQPICDDQIWPFLKSIQRTTKSKLDEIIKEWNLKREVSLSVKPHKRLTCQDWHKDIKEGERDVELTRRAGSLLTGMDAVDALPMLMAWNNRHCDPPLDEHQVKKIVESIAGRERRKKGMGQEDSELIEKYGKPYYLNKNDQVGAINECYWAGLYHKEHIVLYEPNERTFYRYVPETGIYEEITNGMIKQEISGRILQYSRENNESSLEKKRTNRVLKDILAHLKGISEKRDVFKNHKNFVHLANGVIVFRNNVKADFVNFSPDFYSRNQCPIAFNESAKCERFLNELLLPAVSRDDALIIQKYTGLCLLGVNLIQRFLILDGDPGRGKSTLASLIQKLIGQNNATQLRTKYLNDRFELYRFLKKTLLVGVDVPGNFLSEKGAYVIKGLVGGDWFDSEQKGGTDSFPLQGNFCIIITSNSRLQVRLDGDHGAWKRRLLIVRFEASKPPKKIPEFDEVLIREEGSGILNWALRGLGILLDDIQKYGDIQLDRRAKDIVNTLLAESNSIKLFLADSVIRDDASNLSVSEIEEAYGEYCACNRWEPKSYMQFHKELRELMLRMFASVKSNSVLRDGKSVRGYRKVKFKQ